MRVRARLGVRVRVRVRVRGRVRPALVPLHCRQRCPGIGARLSGFDIGSDIALRSFPPNSFQ